MVYILYFINMLTYLYYFKNQGVSSLNWGVFTSSPGGGVKNINSCVHDEMWASNDVSLGHILHAVLILSGFYNHIRLQMNIWILL